MNPLPTEPNAVNTTKKMQRYFDDMKRWSFTVAYNAYYAFPLKSVQGPYRKIYEDFARRAAEEGYPSCVQIQSTVADIVDVSLREAQYDLHGGTLTYQHHKDISTKNFFASFASTKWRKFLKDLTDLYYELGYRWVVYEEPMFRENIPGKKDRFYKLFQKRFPDSPYPAHHEESEAYCRVQVFKQELLLEFLADLAAHAKKKGFEKVGVMPWFFTPTHENTPAETWHTACDLGRVHHLENLDFLIVRMQPDNVYADAMTRRDGVALPNISYLENQAHQGGKPIIGVNNPSNEHLTPDSTDYTLIPYEYFSRFTLAEAAAAPNGITRHWYGKNYHEDHHHMALYRRINPLLSRMGRAASPIGFVYSYRSLVHALPRSAKQMWTAYERPVRQLMYEEKMPVLTFYGQSLREGLSQAPEVSTLILSEDYPISKEEISLLKKWIKKDSRRRLVLFAGGRGMTWRLENMFFRYENQAPELVELFGIRSNRPMQPGGSAEWEVLKYSGRKKDEAFLGKTFDWRCYGWADVEFRKSKNLDVLYRVKRTGTPAVTRYQYSGGGQAWFVAQNFEGQKNNFPLAEFIRHIAQESLEEHPQLEGSSEILWNITRNDFIIITNPSPEKGWFRLRAPGKKLWNLEKKRFETLSKARINLKAEDALAGRLIEKNQSVLDVEGQVNLESIEEINGQAILKGCFRPLTVIRCRKRPAAVFRDGDQVIYRGRKRKNYYEIQIQQNSAGQCCLRLEFNEKTRSPGKNE